MKLNQIIREHANLIDPYYWPPDFILNQIEVSNNEWMSMVNRFDDRGPDSRNLFLDLDQVNNFNNYLKINTSPDWDKSVYTNDFNFTYKAEALIIIYTGDQAEIAVMHYKDPKIEHDLKIKLRLGNKYR